MIHCRCVLWIHCTWVFIAMYWTVTKWSNLKVAYGIDEWVNVVPTIIWITNSWHHAITYVVKLTKTRTKQILKLRPAIDGHTHSNIQTSKTPNI
jgi:hypothetical protein